MKVIPTDGGADGSGKKHGLEIVRIYIYEQICYRGLLTNVSSIQREPICNGSIFNYQPNCKSSLFIQINTYSLLNNCKT